MGREKLMRVLVAVGGDCAYYEGHDCVMTVLKLPEDEEEAKLLRDNVIEAGYFPHFISVVEDLTGWV
jgi:hypothetical protein